MAAVYLDVPDFGEDATEAMQTQIDEAPDGTEGDPTYIVLPPKTVQMDGILWFERRSHMQLVGTPGRLSTIKVTVPGENPGGAQSQRRHIMIRGSNNIRIAGFRFEGWHDDTYYRTSDSDNNGMTGIFEPLWEYEHFVTITPEGNQDNTGTYWDCHHIIVEDCQVYGISGDFVWMSSSQIGVGPTRRKIEPSTIHIRRLVGEFQGRQGIGIVGGIFIVIEDSVIFARRTGVDIEPLADSHVHYVWVLDSWIWGVNGMVNAASNAPNVGHIYCRGNMSRGGSHIKSVGGSDGRVDWQWINNVRTGAPGGFEPNNGYVCSFRNIDRLEVRDNYMRRRLQNMNQRPLHATFEMRGNFGTEVRITGNDCKGNDALFLTDDDYGATLPWGGGSDISDPFFPGDATVTADGNTGIWDGPQGGASAPYPEEFDPDIDRTYHPEDYPQLDPPRFDLAHHWDELPLSTGRGGKDIDPRPFTQGDYRRVFWNLETYVPRHGTEWAW